MDTQIRQRIITVILLVGLLWSLVILVSAMADWRLPGNEQGYAPEQPVAFSHRLHVGELEIGCKYCHSAAEHGPHAGFPSSDTCMSCHGVVTSTFEAFQYEMQQADKQQRPPRAVVSDELRKLYEHLGLDDNLESAEPDRLGSVPWVRIHNLPDHACFDHRAHVAAGVSCQKCHGPVESMERMRQVHTLSMGWCINCHRESNATGIGGRPVSASTNCSACHY